jgi:hypothetical protein
MNAMVIRVEPAHAESLSSHLAGQGFPARCIGAGELEVLFPAAPALLAAAAELDDWSSRTGAAWTIAASRGAHNATSLYPASRTVTMRCGRAGSSSTFRRRFETWTSAARAVPT